MYDVRDVDGVVVSDPVGHERHSDLVSAACTTPAENTARFLKMGVFALARAPGLRLVGKVG